MAKKKRSGAGFTAALVAALAAGGAQAQGAATVAFASPGVVAVRPDGRQRELPRGAEVQPGDMVDTGEGRAQLRFTDGAMVSLSPATRFRVDEYRFAGRPDGEERGFFSLLKGAMRTITGAIGKTDRKAYRLDTAVATIGIRGTTYSVSYGSSVTVNTVEGAVEACNNGGCLLVGAGQSAYVKDIDTAPAFLPGGTVLPQAAPPPEAPGFTSGEQRDASGNPLIQAPPPPPPHGSTCGPYCQ